MANSIEGYQKYRSNLARRFIKLRENNRREEAKDWLEEMRQTTHYKVAKQLHRQPDIFNGLHDEECSEDPGLNGRERASFGYYVSNEFYGGLAKEVRNLGGVGLAVGSDQGLDFFNMANLDEMYCVDIDPHTHTVTRGYLEIGLRLKDILGRYPTAEEYIHMFEPDIFPITLSLLAAPSARHTFSKREINWLKAEDLQSKIYYYLINKRDYYDKDSWVTDETLEHTLEAYRRGKIHIIQGNIVGNVIPKLARQISDRGQSVSLIYISNAPIRNGQKSLETLKKLPLIESSKIIYSVARVMSDDIAVPIPEGFYGIKHWQMFVFHPFNNYFWPTYNWWEKYEEINPGCYKLVK
jgi:hypothetical protein